MGAGFSRINDLTIIQTSQGLASYLLQEGKDVSRPRVVIGYDARHNSKHFAELAAAVFVTKGIKVWWYEDFVHTPLVSYGVQMKGASAGVMITASHNPGYDNGYKVYGQSGCQINTPVDGKIADSILRNLQPITWNPQVAISSGLRTCVKAEVVPAYLAPLRSLFDIHHWTDSSSSTCPSFVYTPMHGVGLEFMILALEQVGLKSVHRPSERMTIVEQQAKPDPDFPTVRYPNPEEAGALDFAKDTADRNNVTLILANDPDADRLAVAEKVDGTWIQFTGDQVGILLASFILSERFGLLEASEIVRPMEETTVLTTAVSSSMLSHLATFYSVKFEETLTGFKWLGQRALEREVQGDEVLFAYEEALGYMFPSIVRDKDGIAAACIFLAACKNWQSPYAQLQSLYSHLGHYVTLNTYWRSPSLEATSQVFECIRASGSPHPCLVAGQSVLRWRDLTTEYDSGTQDNKPILPCSSSSQMITCWLTGFPNTQGTRCTVRASGTEPKIKRRLSLHR